MNDSEMPHEFKLWAQASAEGEVYRIGDFNLNMLVDLVQIDC